MKPYPHDGADALKRAAHHERYASIGPVFSHRGKEDMPVWLAPLLKALPHLATIATATAHVFTKRKVAHAENQAELIQQQISELQAAASQTDGDVRELAGGLKDALTAIEQGALAAEARLKRLAYVCFASLCVAAVALVVSIAALVAH